ncbi:MAG: hypothetical protein NVSMB51_07040 [Solirubrobacteraceae bacterium]
MPATPQSTKRQTAAVKRSTTAKKAAATRAQNSAVRDAKAAKTSAKRSTTRAGKQGDTVLAQIELLGAKLRNAAQSGITASAKLAADAAKRVRSLV